MVSIRKGNWTASLLSLSGLSWREISRQFDRSSLVLPSNVSIFHFHGIFCVCEVAKLRHFYSCVTRMSIQKHFVGECT